MGDILLDPSEFSELQGRSEVYLFDCSETLSTSLPGAYFLDWRGDPGRVLAYMELLGLKHEAEIVCFSKWGIEDAARIWWVLAMHSYTSVHIINSSVKALQRLGHALVAQPKQLEDVMPILLETDRILTKEESLPQGERVVNLDTTAEATKYIALLTKDAALKPTRDIETILVHLTADTVVVLSGELAGTLLLALTLIGHRNLYWVFGKRTLTAKAYTYSVIQEQHNSASSTLFEVVDIPIEPLSFRKKSAMSPLINCKMKPCTVEFAPVCNSCHLL